MTASSGPRGAALETDPGVRPTRLQAHLADPLYRNGYALVASSTITSVLGLVFWLVAARRFSAETVGVGSAAIAAMVLLANIGQLNLVNALNRFVPRAGPATSRLIAGSYATAMALGGLAAVVFLVGIDSWAPDLGPLRDTPALGLWFVVATMGWTVFVLQDGALTGLRRATYVTVENLLFALAKLGLLVAPAWWVPGYWVFLAWTIPLLPILLVVNAVLFTKVVPHHSTAADHDAAGTTIRSVARFAGSDYAASLIWTAMINALPLIILRLSGAEANAYFYLAWSVYYTLHLAARYMGMSFITEASMDRSRLYRLAYRATLQTFVIVGPAAVTVLVAAPLILRLFGDAYAAEAGALLRILAVASLPATINVIYMAILRVQKRMAALLSFTATIAVLVLGPTLVLVPRMGLVGAGVAWLGAQGAVAGWLVATRFRPVWAAGSTTPAGRRLSAAMASRRGRSSSPADLEIARRILGVTDDRPLEVKRTVGEVRIVHDARSGRVARIASSPAGNAAVAAHIRALEWWERSGSGDARYVPDVVDVGDVAGSRYCVESMLAGVPLDRVAPPLPPLETLVPPVLAMHRATATRRAVDDALIDRLVTGPIGKLAVVAGATRRSSLAELEGELAASVRGSEVVLGMIHGDLCPGNILVDPHDHRLAGIVDWERSHPQSLPDLDLVSLILTARVRRDEELGDVVVAALQDGTWWQEHAGLMVDAPNRGTLGERNLMLLTWLHHVDSNLSKAARFGRNWVWVARNVDHVVDHA